MVGAPALRATHAGDAGRCLLVEEAVCHGVPADALLQVDSHEVGLGTGSEGVTVDSDAAGGGKLHLNGRVGNVDSVISWTHGLLVVREGEDSLLSILHRQHSDVAEVADASATEVCVSEADDDVVAIVIARTPVPSASGLGWSELHHSERNVCANEHVAVSTRTDIGVNILGKVACHGGHGSRKGKNGRCCNKL